MGGVILSFAFVLVGAGILWWIKFSPAAPNLSFAQTPSSLSPTSDVLEKLDTQIAGVIRKAAAGEISLPQVNLESAMKSTVSATLATTPDEFFRQLREEGAQAALGTVAESLEVQAGAVSTQVLNEARYQYCRGVVESYEKAR